MAEAELLSRHEKGAWAEAVAAAWLLERGFYVCVNFAAQGPIDLVAVDKQGRCFPFDVKYISRTQKRKDIASFRVRSDYQKALNVRLFILDHEKNVTIEPPFDEDDNE
jgi:Holliday junction resolvase-like predicted endonuclease